MSVGSNGSDKLNESAAGLRDSVLGPRRVIEVANQNVVAVLQGKFKQGRRDQVRIHMGDRLHRMSCAAFLRRAGWANTVHGGEDGQP